MKILILLMGLVTSPLAMADADDVFEILELFTPRVMVAPPVYAVPPVPVYAPPPVYYPPPAAYYYGPSYGPMPYSVMPYEGHRHHHRRHGDWG